MKPNQNAILMTAAIKEESIAAKKKGRAPKSSNVIAIFRKKSKARLSTDQVNTLFDIVFGAYQQVTGARVSKYGPDSDN